MTSIWVNRQKAIFIPGKPVQKGNISFNSRTGKPYHREGKRLEAWTEEIAWTVKQALEEGRWVQQGVNGWGSFTLPAGMFPWAGDGVRLSTEFRLRRPRNRAGKVASVKPDGDKLHRAVADALAGILYKDDAQIIEGRYAKRYQDEFTPERDEGLWVGFAFRWDRDELVSYLRRTNQD